MLKLLTLGDSIYEGFYPEKHWVFNFFHNLFLKQNCNYTSMEFIDDSFNSKSKTSTGDVDTQVELVTTFFSFHSTEDTKDFYKSMVVDLYRAITCFRMYDSLGEFMAINPELEDCKLDIEELWKEFARLSPEELAEVALELLREI